MIRKFWVSSSNSKVRSSEEFHKDGLSKSACIRNSVLSPSWRASENSLQLKLIFGYCPFRNHVETPGECMKLLTYKIRSYQVWPIYFPTSFPLHFHVLLISNSLIFGLNFVKIQLLWLSRFLFSVSPPPSHFVNNICLLAVIWDWTST